MLSLPLTMLSAMLFSAFFVFFHKDYEASIAYCNKAIELEPDNAKCYCVSEVKKRQSKEALLDYTKAIELEPDNAEWYSERAFHIGF